VIILYYKNDIRMFLLHRYTKIFYEHHIRYHHLEKYIHQIIYFRCNLFWRKVESTCTKAKLFEMKCSHQ